MADKNSNTPTMEAEELTPPADSASPPAAAVGENEASGVRNSDDTAETPEIQAEPAPRRTVKGPPKEPIDTVRVNRIADVEDLMVEKEILVLAFTNRKIPKPYYERWKRETNEIFQLLVRTKKRKKIEGAA